MARGTHQKGSHAFAREERDVQKYDDVEEPAAVG